MLPRHPRDTVARDVTVVQEGVEALPSMAPLQDPLEQKGLLRPL